MAVQRIEDIKPTGIASDVWVGSYDEAKQEMERCGFREIDLAVNAKLRREQGKGAYVSKNGNWTSADFLILPGKNSRLTRSSVISAFAKQATEASRTGEFYLDTSELKEAYEKALEDSVEIDTRGINTKKFHKSNITIYAFGTTSGTDVERDKDDARFYGKFLLNAGINEMPIILPDSQAKPFARKVWFRRLDDDFRSALDGDNWDLYYGYYWVRGVRENAEGVAKNFGSLDNRVQGALNEGKAFEFKGIVYVPTTGKGISLEQ